MAKCVFCGREEAEINGVKMRCDYNSRLSNYLYEEISVPFVFIREQQEDHYVEGPYISQYTVSACQECLIKGSGFYGSGALGVNEYSISSNFAFRDEIDQRAQKIADQSLRAKDAEISQLRDELSFARLHPFKFFLGRF